MKKLTFPDTAHADAFLAELRASGIKPATAHLTPMTREEAQDSLTMPDRDKTVAGAFAGAGLGVAAGIAGVVLSGGVLAVPILLGSVALGAGLGTAAGQDVDIKEQQLESVGVDADNVTPPMVQQVDDHHYDALRSAAEGGQGVVLLQEDASPELVALAAKHGGSI